MMCRVHRSCRTGSVSRCERIDRPLVRSAIDANLPVTFVNHQRGRHAFELFQDSLASREIVRQLLAFYSGTSGVGDIGCRSRSISCE